MRECRRFRVSGLVQGVGFRYYTQRQAVRLGLVGWVSNCIDGDVELIACGSAASLDQLHSWLRTGPTMARVKQVEVEVLKHAKSFTGFSIR